MKKSKPSTVRKVKGWALVLTPDEGATPIVFGSEYGALNARNNTSYPHNYTVVPCTITYSISKTK